MRLVFETGYCQPYKAKVSRDLRRKLRRRMRLLARVYGLPSDTVFIASRSTTAPSGHGLRWTKFPRYYPEYRNLRGDHFLAYDYAPPPVLEEVERT